MEQWYTLSGGSLFDFNSLLVGRPARLCTPGYDSVLEHALNNVGLSHSYILYRNVIVPPSVFGEPFASETVQRHFVEEKSTEHEHPKNKNIVAEIVGKPDIAKEPEPGNYCHFVSRDYIDYLRDGRGLCFRMNDPSRIQDISAVAANVALELDEPIKVKYSDSTLVTYYFPHQGSVFRIDLPTILSNVIEEVSEGSHKTIYSGGFSDLRAYFDSCNGAPYIHGTVSLKKVYSSPQVRTRRISLVPLRFTRRQRTEEYTEERLCWQFKADFHSNNYEEIFGLRKYRESLIEQLGPTELPVPEDLLIDHAYEKAFTPLLDRVFVPLEETILRVWEAFRDQLPDGEYRSEIQKKLTAVRTLYHQHY